MLGKVFEEGDRLTLALAVGIHQIDLKNQRLRRLHPFIQRQQQRLIIAPSVLLWGEIHALREQGGSLAARSRDKAHAKALVLVLRIQLFQLRKC